MSLFAVNVIAIGIAPANKEILFEPSLQKSLVYRIYNTEHKDFTAKISVNGTISKYVKIPNKKIIFSKNDNLKNFQIEINLPKNYEELSGELIISTPTLDVKSKLIVKSNGHKVLSKKAVIPTGNVVTDDDEVDNVGLLDNTGWLVPGLLLIIIFINVIYFTVGKTVMRSPKRSVEDIIKKLKRMSPSSFHKHVNKETNDIAKWLEEMGKPGLAFKIYDVTSQNHMIKLLEASLIKKEPEKSPKELKKEIIELKKELDTFDFDGFEKTL